MGGIASGVQDAVEEDLLTSAQGESVCAREWQVY